jgi:hypothetical protein
MLRRPRRLRAQPARALAGAALADGAHLARGRALGVGGGAMSLKSGRDDTTASAAPVQQTIVCDQCGRSVYGYCSPDQMREWTGRLHGWVYVGGRDYCATCAAQRKAP